MSLPMQQTAKFSLQPTTFEEGMRFAELIAKSSFVPTNLRGKVEDVFLTVQFGMELNLAPLQALQNIAVINGRPSLWGDAMLALVRVHPDFEWIKEEPLPGTVDERGYKCTVKRKGQAEHITTFTVADAKVAGLWGKTGPWTTSPKRMTQMRARGFNLRDTFPDALKGIISREEAEDYPIVGSSATPVQTTQYAAPLYTDVAMEDILTIDNSFDPHTGEIVSEELC